MTSPVLATGIDVLDREIGGLTVGGLTLLVGRPDTGRTRLAMTLLATVAARSDVPLAVFSLDRSESELRDVQHSIVSAPPRGHDVEPASNSRGDRQVMDALIHPDDDWSTGVPWIRASLRRQAARGVGVVLVCGLEYLPGDGGIPVRERPAATARALRGLAADRRVAMMVTVLLPRGEPVMEGERPRFMKRGWRREIRSHADLILMLDGDPPASSARRVWFMQGDGGPMGAIDLRELGYSPGEVSG
jgi:replicative DNA helicase